MGVLCLRPACRGAGPGTFAAALTRAPPGCVAKAPLKQRSGDATGGPTGTAVQAETPPTRRQQLAPKGKAESRSGPGSPNACVLRRARGSWGLEAGAPLNPTPPGRSLCPEPGGSGRGLLRGAERVTSSNCKGAKRCCHLAWRDRLLPGGRVWPGPAPRGGSPVPRGHADASPSAETPRPARARESGALSGPRMAQLAPQPPLSSEGLLRREGRNARAQAPGGGACIRGVPPRTVTGGGCHLLAELSAGPGWAARRGRGGAGVRKGRGAGGVRRVGTHARSPRPPAAGPRAPRPPRASSVSPGPPPGPRPFPCPPPEPGRLPAPEPTAGGRRGSGSVPVPPWLLARRGGTEFSGAWVGKHKSDQASP